MLGREILDLGFVWRVRDGQCISIFGDKWVPRSRCFRIIFAEPNNAPLSVSSLISSNSSWNISSIFIFLKKFYFVYYT